MSAIVVFKCITVLSNVTFDTFETPDKVQVPHRTPELTISKNINTVSLLVSHDLLNICSFSFLITREGIVERILDIVTVLDFVRFGKKFLLKSTKVL